MLIPVQQNSCHSFLAKLSASLRAPGLHQFDSLLNTFLFQHFPQISNVLAHPNLPCSLQILPSTLVRRAGPSIASFYLIFSRLSFNPFLSHHLKGKLSQLSKPFLEIDPLCYKCLTQHRHPNQPMLYSDASFLRSLHSKVRILNHPFWEEAFYARRLSFTNDNSYLM